MNIHKGKRSYGGTVLIITLLTGVGAVLGYSYWELRSEYKLTDASPVSDYRIDWLGI